MTNNQQTYQGLYCITSYVSQNNNDLLNCYYVERHLPNDTYLLRWIKPPVEVMADNHNNPELTTRSVQHTAKQMKLHNYYLTFEAMVHEASQSHYHPY